MRASRESFKVSVVDMKDFSYITNSHPEFIENLYRDFVKDPDSVDPELKKFFEGFDFAIGNGKTSLMEMVLHLQQQRRRRLQQILLASIG